MNKHEAKTKAGKKQVAGYVAAKGSESGTRPRQNKINNHITKVK